MTNSTRLMHWMFCGIIAACTLDSCGPDHKNMRQVIPDSLSLTGPAPKTVSITLNAKIAEHEYIQGKKTVVWAYNGQIPGPAIHANVGDIVDVKFINSLPEPSMIHWHGMELPATMDGSPMAQKPVQPGETFRYTFKVNRAATYWYHSHVKTNEQVERGLYGRLVVHSPEQRNRLDLPTEEYTLMLDDVLLDEDHQIVEGLPKDPLERAKYLLDGRHGNTLIVNGIHQPTITLKRGKPVRLRFVNSANARFFRLSFPGARAWKIGADLGLLVTSKPISLIKSVPNAKLANALMSSQNLNDGISLVPGDRVEVLLVPEADDARIEWHDTKRGDHIGHYTTDGRIDVVPDPGDGQEPSKVLVEFAVKGESPDDEYVAPVDLAKLNFLSKEDITEKKPLMVTFGHGLPNKNGDVMFFATAMMEKGKMVPYPMMKLMKNPKKALNARVGETRIIEVHNMTKGMHPFHMHGFAFQHLDTVVKDMDDMKNNRTIVVEPSEREWSDTISVMPRPGFRMRSKTITRLLVRFDDKDRAGQLVAHGGKPLENQSGGWLVHCHIMEHARYGMATWINLFDK